LGQQNCMLNDEIKTNIKWLKSTNWLIEHSTLYIEDKIKLYNTVIQIKTREYIFINKLRR